MSVKPITDPQLMFPNPQVVKNDGTSSIAFGGLGIFLWIALLALLRFVFEVRSTEGLKVALLGVCFAVPAFLHYRWIRGTEYHPSSEGLRVIKNGQTVFYACWQACDSPPRGALQLGYLGRQTWSSDTLVQDLPNASDSSARNQKHIASH